MLVEDFPEWTTEMDLEILNVLSASLVLTPAVIAANAFNRRATASPDRSTLSAMVESYRENRTERYYGGGRSTEPQAAAMVDLARGVHEYVVSQIREGGVCICKRS